MTEECQYKCHTWTMDGLIFFPPPIISTHISPINMFLSLLHLVFRWSFRLSAAPTHSTVSNSLGHDKTAVPRPVSDLQLLLCTMCTSSGPECSRLKEFQSKTLTGPRGRKKKKIRIEKSIGLLCN